MLNQARESWEDVVAGNKFQEIHLGLVMSPHHSDQITQRSQVSRIIPQGCSLREVSGWVGK